MMTHLKAQVQKIIENISQLEKLQSVNQDDTRTLELKQNLIIHTNELFTDAKRQTNRRLVQKIKKLKAKRRRRKKSKQKILRPTATASKSKKQIETSTQSAVEEIPTSIKEPAENAQQQQTENEFCQLRNYQHAQRYLRTFELLEMLHYARSNDKQLTCQFRETFVSLRAIWNSVLLENTPKRTEARRIEDQWNEVIFGASEQTFYTAGGKKTERERMREFLRNRQTWDSYVVRSKKHGSCIPLGWVLPKNNVSEKWEQYKST